MLEPRPQIVRSDDIWPVISLGFEPSLPSPQLIDVFLNGRKLAPVRRTVVRLHRHLRTVLTLLRRAAASEDDETPEGFDDVASRLMSRLEAVDHDVYALQERARLLHEEIDPKLSSETNHHLYILSLMTAFLLPPSLVTSFFGMNTSSLPFAEGIGGTAYAVGFILFSVAAAWWVLRRAGIL